MKMRLKRLIYKLILLVLLITASQNHGWAKKESEYPVKIETSLNSSLVYGSLGEYVYSGSRTVSRLDWDMQGIVFTGFSINAEISKSCIIHAEFNYGISDDAGRIRDYDWENSDSLTNYSNHRCILEKAFTFKASAGYRLSLSDSITLTPDLFISAFDIKLTALDGYYQYPPDSAPIDLYGTVISYRQRYLIQGIGITAALSLKKIKVSAELAYGFCGKCRAVDSHHLRDTDFYDSFDSVKMFSARAAAQFSLTEHHFAGLFTGLISMPETKGDEYHIDTSSGARSNTLQDSAGVKLKLYQTGIYAGLKI